MRYAYHGTSPENLASIANNGLAPLSASRGEGVWFVATMAGARRYGRAVVRFPWPDDAVYSGLIGAGGRSYYVPRWVEPGEELRVSIDGGAWAPLATFYNPDWGNEPAPACWFPGQTYAAFGPAKRSPTPGPENDSWLAPCVSDDWRRQLEYRGEVAIPSRKGVRLTPLADLTGIVAVAWDPRRLPRIYEAHRAGVPLPPIDVSVNLDGRVVLADGNHRLVAARDLALAAIPVEWDW